MLFRSREVQARKKNASSRREKALAKRVFFIILTDCACWMPIIVMGIRSLVEKDYSPRGDLPAWIAVFVLPINSALNPIIYTLSTPQVCQGRKLVKCNDVLLHRVYALITYPRRMLKSGNERYTS